jgi:hypothetical protein
MSNIAPAFIVVNPSFIEPGIIMPYTQASGAFELVYGGGPVQKLSEGDLYVYMKRLDVRTKVAAGQSAYNLLPSISTTFSQIQTPTYLLRVRGEYDHHDTAAVSRWGSSIVEMQTLGMRQGHYQLCRTALLYGMQPQNGEGITNANGATVTTLPPDSQGSATVQTYDNGEMAFYLIGQIQAIKSRTNQLGLPRRFVICGPQRVLGQFEYQNIVQLVQFQRIGAGSTSTAGVVKDVLEMNDDEILWVYDDTLQGKGTGGGNNDLVIISMPEVKKPRGMRINTNEFAGLEPGIEACSLQYCDMAAPREIPTPLPGGATDVLSEWRITSGWPVRPESITLITMLFQ